MITHHEKSWDQPNAQGPIILTEEQLSAIAPNCINPSGWIVAINIAAIQYGINENVARYAMFLAQIAHESLQLTRLEENLNYSAERLTEVWPRRFPDLQIASRYARNPHKLADHVYASRHGNGDESTGDGYRFRGRGLIGITFKDNYRAFGEAIGDTNVVLCPDMLCTKKYAALSAAWYWSSRNLNPLADDLPEDDQESDFVTISRRINGGTTGLQQRQLYWKRAMAALS